MNQEITREFKNFFENLLSERPDLEKNNKNIFNLGRVSSGDEGDRAMDEREKSLNIKLKAREDFYRKKISKALKKIENGEFGECEECGSEISLERLRARPTATMCIHCKEEQELVEGQVHYRKRSHTLGQEIVNTSSQNAS